ncbi:MAG: UUP1 family membrane protein [Deltaproteobacteria bacterium]|nr:UUP1 family membrane protein [Deltaproteobacteria bacterium]
MTASNSTSGKRRQIARIVLGAGLILLPLGISAYKIFALGYDLTDILPQRRYRVTYDLRLDGQDEAVRVRTYLPGSDTRQEITQEQDHSPGFHLEVESSEQGREAVWSAARGRDGARIEHAFSVTLRPVRFAIDPALEVPTRYPDSLSPYLAPEEAIQVGAPEIQAVLEEIGADEGTVLERLRKIHERTASLGARPFKGLTDALTALRLGEASCNGKSRLFVALARTAGIPARLVGGLILDAGTKKTSHQWVEAWVGGHWVPFGPTNGHFAELPERYLTLYRGDAALFRHTRDINFDYRFHVSRALVPSPAARTWLPAFNVWALFERLGLSFALLRTVLMLPLGALLVVLFRNVVGMPTYGTFLPALLAAGAGLTGPGWGVAGLLIVVGCVAAVRWVFHRLQLLHSPMLAILLAAVTSSILATALLADHLQLGRLAYVTAFPIAVLAITAERFYLSLVERGSREALLHLGGTMVVMLACYVVMTSLAFQVLIIGFPEVLLLVVAADVYLGRWVGMRLFEYLRFRRLLAPEGEA